MTSVERWQRGHAILGLAVRDMDRTRDLRLDLEILQGVRRDDPALEIISEHARGLCDELQSLRSLREDLRAAAAADREDMAGMLRRVTP